VFEDRLMRPVTDYTNVGPADRLRSVKRSAGGELSHQNAWLRRFGAVRRR
jgi:hypothetical protein